MYSEVSVGHVTRQWLIPEGAVTGEIVNCVFSGAWMQIIFYFVTCDRSTLLQICTVLSQSCISLSHSCMPLYIYHIPLHTDSCIVITAHHLIAVHHFLIVAQILFLFVNGRIQNCNGPTYAMAYKIWNAPITEYLSTRHNVQWNRRNAIWWRRA